MDESLLKTLLDKYLAGTASPEEVSVLLSWYASVDRDSIVIPFTSETEKEKTMRRMQATLEGYAAESLASITQQRNAAGPDPVPLRQRLLRYAAAAALLGTLCLGGFWVFRRYKPAPVIASMPVSHDLAPGHDGAILTVAGGRQIVLDSAADGQIAVQGNGRIVKKGGVVQYEPDGGVASSPVYNTMTTPRGRQFRLVLPDGTRVWLNAASSITYPVAFEGDERLVILTGEAYFEVTYSARQPFRVKVGSEVIEDLGTHFNINAYPDEPVVKTTLLEGLVRVNTPGRSVLLKPGEQAGASPSGSIRVTAHTNTEEVLAWKEGLFQFDRADIQTVMRQIARWYDVEVRFEGPVPGDRFWGKLPRDAAASQLLQVLQKEQVHFRIENKKIIVTQ